MQELEQKNSHKQQQLWVSKYLGLPTRKIHSNIVKQKMKIGKGDKDFVVR